MSYPHKTELLLVYRDKVILGPVLFIIYINDISEASKLFNCIIYDYDTALNSTLNIFKFNEQFSENINT